MAHAKYECCMICDRKLWYNSFAKSKKFICKNCAKEFKKLTNIEIKTEKDLVNWIKTTPKNTVEYVLLKLNFKFCFYPNYIDEIVSKKLETINASNAYLKDIFK